MIDSIIYDFESDELEDIKRCVENLYSTRAGSQPMDREFGIDYDGIVGLPLNVAKNQMAIEIIDKTERYEPRVAVDDIEADADPVTGQLVIKVRLVKGDVDDE